MTSALNRMLEFVRTCDDAEALAKVRKNALAKGERQLADVAFRKMVTIVPELDPTSLDYEFWVTVNALEQTLREERGKTIRLSRTRQKVERDGVKKTLEDLASSKEPAEGFGMLVERGMTDLTMEAIILRRIDEFSEAVVSAARQRLVGAGYVAG